jgi:acetyl esterase/lipase
MTSTRRILPVLLAAAAFGCGRKRDADAPRADANLADATATPGDAAAAGDAGPSGDCAPVEATVQRDVPYRTTGDAAADAATRLDVYPPAGAACDRPVVIWVHGGAWSNGDKANGMTDKVAFFNGLGAVFVSIDYRLTTADNGVAHPDHVEDVAAAVRWVHDHAADYGARADRVALLGHSAGAHLVALTLTNPRFLAAQDLAASDLACVGSYDTDYTVADIVDRDAQYAVIFTEDPAAWEDASPSAHVRPDLPPQQLACRGAVGRVAQCEAYAEALRAEGNEADVIDAAALSHEEVNSAIGAPGDTVMTPAVRAFLEDCWASP